MNYVFLGSKTQILHNTWPKKGENVMNYVFLGSKTQILRNTWNFLRDCTVAWSQLLETLIKTCIIQTDIEAGFDTVSRGHIKEVLKLIGCPESLIDKIFNLGKHARAKLAVNLEGLKNRFFKITSGTAQGQASSAILFNLAFFLFYLFLHHKSELFGTYKIILDLIDHVTGKFSDSDIKTQLDLDTSISYSDDGLITVIYKDSTSITNILDLFKRFSSVSGLKISPAISKIIPINFTFSEDDIVQLELYGLNSDNFFW